MIKRVLALIVALSLFVCTPVVGFATGTTIRFQDYYFPHFTNVDIYSPPSSSRVTYFSFSPRWYSGLPSSCSFSSVNHSFSTVIFNVYGRDMTTYATDGNSKQQEFQYRGIKAGYYTSLVSFTTTSSLSESFISSMSSYVGFRIPNSTTGYVAAPISNFRLVSRSPASDSSSYTYSFSFTYHCPDDYNMKNNDYYMQIRVNFPSSIYLRDISFVSSQYFFASGAPFNPVDQPMGDVIGSYFDELMSFQSGAFQGLISYFLSQQGTTDKNYSDAVPDRLPGQQDVAQKQLDDYEQKEQQIFDNLDTSLDNLKLDQYQKFDTSIVSSMTFINKYVTKGFDGLGKFKIILFLPMVIGIGLSVIGRMGAMMSRVSVSDRRKGRGP